LFGAQSAGKSDTLRGIGEARGQLFPTVPVSICAGTVARADDCAQAFGREGSADSFTALYEWWLLCFADLQLLPAILTTNELDQASEALYRVPSYRLRVRVYADSKIDDLIQYWGQYGREKFIRPLLESSAEFQAGPMARVSTSPF
jgi:hypothetical protein